MSPNTPTAGGPLLDRHITVLHRPDGSVQLGWDPERAVVVSPPCGVGAERLVAVLRLLDGKNSRPHIMWSATEHGVSPDDMAALLTELRRAGLLDESQPSPVPTPSIRVHGRGPLADAIAAALPRASAHVSRSAGRNESDPRRWDATCVVLTDDLVVEPRLVTDLIKLGIPHLHVRTRDGRGVVGPLVVPGRTSCLRCADLSRATHDEHWPHLAAQLLGRVGDASPAMIAATAALTLAQIEAICTPMPGNPPASLDATLEIDLSIPRIVVRRWTRQPQCNCTYLAPDTGTAEDFRP